jgi:hypothetical protein
MRTRQAALISSPFVGALMAKNLLACYSIPIHGLRTIKLVVDSKQEVAAVS